MRLQHWAYLAGFRFSPRRIVEQQIHPVLTTLPGVEATLRQNAQGQLLFLLNHQDAPTQVALPPGKRYHDLLRDQEVAETLPLEAYDVAILTKA